MAERGNHAVRWVTMAGAMRTVAGNGEAGYARQRRRSPALQLSRGRAGG